jgi:hypothetical protein
MKHPNCVQRLKYVCCMVVALGVVAVLAGCEEANVALDNLLGRQSQEVASGPPQSSAAPQGVIPVKKRAVGERAPDAEAQPAPGPAPEKPTVQPEKRTPPPGKPTVMKEEPKAPTGKRSEPGKLAPPVAKEPTAEDKKMMTYTPGRDPFKMPTAVLPTECPPSMPLCRFDRSQLKLVGVLQVEDGQFKGLVEDPDGRGYFIATGMQIGGAIVTQVTNRGVTLRVLRTRQDVQMPLFTGGEREF